MQTGKDVWQSTSPEETRALGRVFAARLKRGDCVAMYGDLGSGKTCLSQGICEGLGVVETVNSPTFILVNEYVGKDLDGNGVPVHHFDLYRLGDAEDLMDLGWYDYLDGRGICLVEWADRASELMPPGTISVHIEAPELHVRVFTLICGG